jgi:DNA-binding response OmpR family regulator
VRPLDLTVLVESDDGPLNRCLAAFASECGSVPTVDEERAGQEAWRVVLRRWPDAVGLSWRYARVDGPLEL